MSSLVHSSDPQLISFPSCSKRTRDLRARYDANWVDPGPRRVKILKRQLEAPLAQQRILRIQIGNLERQLKRSGEEDAEDDRKDGESGRWWNLVAYAVYPSYSEQRIERDAARVQRAARAMEVAVEQEQMEAQLGALEEAIRETEEEIFAQKRPAEDARRQKEYEQWAKQTARGTKRQERDGEIFQEEWDGDVHEHKKRKRKG